MKLLAELDLERLVDALRDQVDGHLAGRSGTWIASFVELVALAAELGVPVSGMQPAISRLRGPDIAGEADDHEERAALIAALVGRWAAYIAITYPPVIPSTH